MRKSASSCRVPKFPALTVTEPSSSVPEARRVYNVYPTQIVIMDPAGLKAVKTMGGIVLNVPIVVSADVKKETRSDAKADISATLKGLK